jgi:hypothetical protein
MRPALLRRYEVLAMLQHSNHLEAEYGAGPHTISVPRLRPADGSDLSIRPPHEVRPDMLYVMFRTICSMQHYISWCLV